MQNSVGYLWSIHADEDVRWEHQTLTRGESTLFPTEDETDKASPVTGPHSPITFAQPPRSNIPHLSRHGGQHQRLRPQVPPLSRRYPPTSLSLSNTEHGHFQTLLPLRLANILQPLTSYRIREEILDKTVLCGYLEVRILDNRQTTQGHFVARISASGQKDALKASPLKSRSEPLPAHRVGVERAHTG